MNILKLVVAIVGVLASLVQIVLIVRFSIATTEENLLSAACCFLICVGIEMASRSMEWLDKALKN